MGAHATLTASDGFELGACVARPNGAPLAGLVVLQEAFGVNRHMRNVTDRWAKEGFLAVCPALFDRIQPGFEVGYSPEDLQKGMAMIRQGTPDDRLKDVAAAIDYARRESGKKVGVIGYCLGGTVAWLAAARLHPDAAVAYYGGQILHYASERPRVPIQLHFGLEDAHIPKADIDAKVAAVYPNIPIFWYEGAGHGFDTADRASYNPDAARLARQRSLEFLKQHLT